MVLSKARTFKLSIRGQHKPPAGETTSIGVWMPLPDTKLARDPPLSDDEQTKVDELREWVKTVQLGEDDEYAHWEQRFLNGEGCLARFLKAEDWKMEPAKKRLQETLEWRRDYKPDLIKPEEIQEETEGGKIVVTGFTKAGLPVIYLRPARENTEPSPTQVRHMIFELERACEIMPEGVSKVAMVISFAGASAKSSPPMKITKSVIEILQKHYCERLGQALVVNLPWYLKSFFATVSPFLDPQTRQKLKMNPDLKDIIPEEQLDADFGGQYKFEYKHDIYLPAICKFCGVADDGTRTKERPGPVRTATAATTATNVTGMTEDGDDGDGHAAPQDHQLDATSSRTAVSDSAPSRADGKKVGEAPADRSTTRQPAKRPWWAMCMPGRSTAANYDDDTARSGRKSPSLQSLRSRAASLKGPGRKSAVERNRADAATESVTDPNETARLEQTFKDAEPKRAVRKEDPEILHALEADVEREAAEPAMSLSSTGAPTPGLTSQVEDAAGQALALLRKAASGDEAPRQKPLIRQPTHDHAVELARPAAAERSETLGEGELTFDVAKSS